MAEQTCDKARKTHENQRGALSAPGPDTGGQGQAMTLSGTRQPAIHSNKIHKHKNVVLNKTQIGPAGDCGSFHIGDQPSSHHLIQGDLANPALSHQGPLQPTTTSDDA